MLTPYQNLRHRIGLLEHDFVQKYGARPGFRMQRYLRVNGVRAGEREHLWWIEWNGTKRELRQILAEAKDTYPFHEDFKFFVEVSRKDVKRDVNFEEDVTSLIDDIDAAR